jgi:predicted lipoprotein with Yx(FWY)xxD motif
MTSAFDRLPRRPLVAGLAGLAAAGLLAACSSGNGTAAASGGTGSGQKDASAITVSAHTMTGVGTVLTDQSGKTLYTPQQEAGGVIKCTASCLSFWFPVTVGKGAAPHAASNVTGTLGTIQRPDGGGSQLTYDGKPLYTFRLDSGPGQLHGNNFSDQFGSQSFTWHAVTVGGGAATSGQPSSQPSSSYQGGGGGYSGY